MKDHFSPIAVIEYDKEGLFLEANIAAQELFGIPKFDSGTKLNAAILKIINIDAHSHQDIVLIKGHKYHLQKIASSQKTWVILQPLAYLQSHLGKNFSNSEDAFDAIMAQSKVMKSIITQAKSFSCQDEPLLISGETGSGKDILALACHRYSSRSHAVFHALNCAALPDEVIETELFGYAQDAYGKIAKEKKGFFEQAHGGTVFLDCIDEMSPNLQKKLLRVIHDGTFRRVGDENVVTVDVRIICATQANLNALVEKGQFRSDLYYRLNVLSLAVPPLRERKPDILPLIQFFVAAFAKRQGIKIPPIDNNVVELLVNYSWPGNVRQLKNVIYSALSQLKNRCLTISDLVLPSKVPLDEDMPILAKMMENKTLDEMVKQFEKSILTALYIDFPSSRKLSKRLGLSHTAVANKLREYSIGKRMA